MFGMSGKTTLKLFTVSFLLGASMEMFMIKTGFYNVVTRKEGERRLETELQAMERQERLNRLNIDVKAALDDSQNSEKNMKIYVYIY